MKRIIFQGSRIKKYQRYNSKLSFDNLMTAQYISNKIDINLIKDVLVKDKSIKQIISTSSSLFIQFKNEITEELPFYKEEIEHVKFINQPSYEEGIVSNEKDRFMIIFKYGSVTFLNIDDLLQKNLITSILNSQKDNEKVELQVRDDLLINIDKEINDQWFKYKQDKLHVKLLNINNINIISSVLAKSVALKNREFVVDSILKQFKSVNEMIQNNKKLVTKKEENILAPVIIQSNSLHCDILLNIKLFERPEIVWNISQYDDLFDKLNEDFELNERYKSTTRKLEFISESSKFYSEFGFSKKAEHAEILIIILIMMEVFLGLLHSYEPFYWHEREEKERRERKEKKRLEKLNK